VRESDRVDFGRGDGGDVGTLLRSAICLAQYIGYIAFCGVILTVVTIGSYS
jgi:hypothetical protein